MRSRGCARDAHFTIVGRNDDTSIAAEVFC
jgi:hypothetical protein